jgi:uncharacterized membrane protein
MSLKVRLGNGLIPLNLLTWVLILVVIFFPSNIFRIVLGIPFLLLFPGYTLSVALFTKKEGVSGIERVALSFGLSIAVVALIGLILNYTPWGIRLEPILYSGASFILITSVIAWLRRRVLTKEERFNVELYLRLPGWGRSVWDRILTIIMALAIIGALGTLSYVIIAPKVGEVFTEFYILGQGGKAVDYPKELKVGEEAKVIVGIINHERKKVSYRVEVKIGSNKIELGSVTLDDGQKWEGEAVLVPETVGEGQRIDFLLYKGDEVEPSPKSLHLWVNVTE